MSFETVLIVLLLNIMLFYLTLCYNHTIKSLSTKIVTPTQYLVQADQ